MVTSPLTISSLRLHRLPATLRYCSSAMLGESGSPPAFLALLKTANSLGRFHGQTQSTSEVGTIRSSHLANPKGENDAQLTRGKRASRFGQSRKFGGSVLARGVCLPGLRSGPSKNSYR